MAFYGVYRGQVTQATDPEGLGRLKALVPQVLGTQETDWAWPATPNIRDVLPLTPGNPVWVMFEGGDVQHPVWIGTWRRTGAMLGALLGSSVTSSIFGDVGDPGDDATAARVDHIHDRQDDGTLFWMMVGP